MFEIILYIWSYFSWICSWFPTVVCMDSCECLSLCVCLCLRHWTVATLTRTCSVFLSIEMKINMKFSVFNSFTFISLFRYFFSDFVFVWICCLWSQKKCVCGSRNKIHFFGMCREHLDAANHHIPLATFRSHQRIQLLCIKSICLLFEHASFVTTSTSCVYDK